MPPVRWKLFAAVALICFSRQIIADPLHDSMPMASDGWRPILRTVQRDAADEITMYKDPQTDADSEPIKAQVVPVQTPTPTSSTSHYHTISTTNTGISSPSGGGGHKNGGNKLQGKVPPHVKQHPIIMLMPKNHKHGHGPHIPLTAPTTKNKKRRHPPGNKHQQPNGKRKGKPGRGGPVIAHSMKNEVYVPAPSAIIGSYAYINQGNGNIKPQSNKHFQAQFPTQFGMSGYSGLGGTNDVLIQQVPIQTYLIQNRNPIQNDNYYFTQNDEYTRNLVPPPYKPLPFQQGKEKQKIYKQKEQMVTESAASINSPQFLVGKPKDGTRHRTAVPENIIVQLPPPFNLQTQFDEHYNEQNSKDQVEVQVTKEKLKVFHNNVPPNFNPTGNFQQEQVYNFQNANNKPDEEDGKIYTFDSFPTINKNSKPHFRKPTAETYSEFEEPKREIPKKPASDQPNFPTYEVTEGKRWHEGLQPFLSTRPSAAPPAASPPQPPPRGQRPQTEFLFLPTPYTSDGIPTSPTQSEISSIYTELNQRNRPAPNEYSTLNPDYFNIKEVSTHYPIVGKPEAPTMFSSFGQLLNSEDSNEITTIKEEEENMQIYQPEEEPAPTMPPTRPTPAREWQRQRQRVQQRRRRPTQRTRTTSTTTTTEYPVPETYDVQRVRNSEGTYYSDEIQRPHRRRRPTRVRTTEATPETTKIEVVARPTTAVRQKYRNRNEIHRSRPTVSAESVEEMPSNHKMTEPVSYSGGFIRQENIASGESKNQFRHHYTTEDAPVSYENEVSKIETKRKDKTENYPRITTFGKNYHSVTSEEEDSTSYTKTTEKPETPTETIASEEQPTLPRRRSRYPSTTTTTSATTTTTTTEDTSNILTPENEVDYDYSTQTNNFEPTKQIITIQEIYTQQPDIQTTLATTTPSTTTTTTTEASTTKIQRTRGRPIKYDNKNRPRFSVKEYRQRLSQYSSTTTETPKVVASEPPRLRFPNRSRKPITYTQEEEPSTERSKFTPKDPRHRTASERTEAPYSERRVNMRIRPFGRYRSTTEPTTTTTTQKVSVKPNIFSNLRRPPSIGLRQKIMGRYNRTAIIEKTTEKTTEAQTEPETTVPIETTSITTEIPLHSYMESGEKITEATEAATEEPELEPELEPEREPEPELESETEEMAHKEIMKNESVLLSQRVADLTLSAQKEYETPGLFKSLSPNSRIVPNYFTISTDDPILPIEAFFPNLKDKNL